VGTRLETWKTDTRTKFEDFAYFSKHTNAKIASCRAEEQNDIKIKPRICNLFV